MKKLLTSFCFLFFALQVSATDTARVLRTDDLFRMVLAHHPVAQQAALLSDAAKEELRIAKGFLDPKLQSDYNGKVLSGQEYFSMWDHSLSVPVWWGTDLKIGYENNAGQNVNPEDATPSKGLWYVGISVPLGQGLWIDERRNTIRQAQLLPAMAEAEKVKTINKLLFDAAKEYWDWYYFFHRQELLGDAYRLSAERFEAVKLRFLQGDVPAIDTLEALIAMQEREVLYSQGKQDFENSRLRLSLYLWNSEGQPVELPASVVPGETIFIQQLSSDSLQSLVNAARQFHPDLLKLDLKNEQLSIEEKYQRDQLKPKANLRYNVLTKNPADLSDAGSQEYYTNNYKLGFSFSFPLFLRKERGKVRLTEIKQQQTTLERDQRERSIVNEMASCHLNWLAYSEQIVVLEQQVRNAKLLRDAEEERFRNGESSFFLVNTRELSLITAKIRLLEAQSKFQKNRAQLYWSAGMLQP